MSSDQENQKVDDVVYSDEEAEDQHHSSVVSQGGRKDGTDQHQENQTQITHEGKTENDEHHEEGKQPKHQEIVSVHETNQHFGIVSEPTTVLENTGDHQILVSGHQQKHQQAHDTENPNLLTENQQKQINKAITEFIQPMQEVIKSEPAEPVSLDLTEAVKHTQNDHQEEERKRKKLQDHYLGHQHHHQRHQNQQHKQQHTQQNITKQQVDKLIEEHHQKIPHNQVTLSDNNYQQTTPAVEEIYAKEEKIAIEPNENQITTQQKILLPGPNKFAAHLQGEKVGQKLEPIKQPELYGDKTQQKDELKQHEEKTLSQSRQQFKKDGTVEKQQSTEIKLIKEPESLEFDHAGAADDSVISRRILAASVKQAPKKQQEEGKSSKVCECSIM